METIWKVFSCFVSFLILELCNGLPLDLQNTYTDGHTQLFTSIIAVLLTICGVVCLVGCLCCQRRNGFKDEKKEFHDSPVVVSVASNLDHGHVNPISNGEFTIFTPLAPPHFNNNVFASNQQPLVYSEDDYKVGDIDVRSWFDSNEKDFPRSKLKYLREIGKGWFGRVVEGTAQGLIEEGTWMPAVVRILEASASSRQRVLFLSDANIYRCPPHPNILRLLGRCLDNVPLLLLQEHTSQGDLKSYLRSQQITKEKFLSSDLPLRFCYEIASALRHLHTHTIAHPDLATRNCQLTTSMHLKLGDYGCSITDYPEDYYHGTENVPVRWCAPECVTYTATTIQTKNVTQAGNIWSLGVCLWEIYECGAQPYGNLNDDEVVSQVLGPSNVRLAKPFYNVLYTDYVYRLMQMCWSTYESRPAITQIEPMLADLMQVQQNAKDIKEEPQISIQDFDVRWENFKPNILSKNDDLTNINNMNPNVDDQNTKCLSASLHNLAGSLDNLLDKSWSSNHGKDASSVESSPHNKHKLEFKLGPVLRTSSESETEDENWKKKIERGAYTEKVRQKSRSVADLMVLTHIDCSESDSETPLPSIDYRTNYKNVRYAPKQNLENVSLTFGSEGNLLSVKDTFQQELKKLQDERRDSLLFVPDNIRQPQTPSTTSTKLLEELNSTAIIEPQKQIFNVYNVVAISPKYSPLHTANLNQIINYNENILPDLVLNTIDIKREVPKLSEIIENNIELMDYIIEKYENISEEDTQMDENSANTEVAKEDEQIVCDNPKDIVQSEIESTQIILPKENCQDGDDCVDDYVVEDVSCKEVIENEVPEEERTNVQVVEANEFINAIEDSDNLTEKNLLNDLQGELNNTYIARDEAANDVNVKEEILAKATMEEATLNNHSDTSDILNKDSLENENLLMENIISDSVVQSDQSIINECAISKCNVNDVKHQFENTEVIDDKKSECIASNEVRIDLSTISKSLIVKTQDFINNEILQYEDSTNIKVNFDISEEQEAICPNSLTHSVLTSTPYKTRGLSDNSVILGASDDYSIDYYSGIKTTTDEDMFSSNFEAEIEKSDGHNMNYSLETWDNFLGKSFDEQHNNFDSQPQSLLFLENQINENRDAEASNETKTVQNRTYTKEETKSVDIEDIKVDVEPAEAYDNPGFWENENSGGWYLHPQVNNEELSGSMELAQNDSYVGFSMDDEIMAAIRNELMMKLPQAQRASSEQLEDSDEYETSERNEVFLRYNCYNTPLSPILEESDSELLNSGQSTPHCTINTELDDSDSEWSDPGIGANSLDDDTLSPRLESPHKIPLNRHTPSQDSSCSNDTLFNLEELQYTEKQQECDDKSLQMSNKDDKNATFVKSSDETLDLEKSVENIECVQKTEIIPSEQLDQLNATFTKADVCNIIDKINVEDESTIKEEQKSPIISNNLVMNHSGTHSENVIECDNIDSSLPSSTDTTVIKIADAADEIENVQKEVENSVSVSDTKPISDEMTDKVVTVSSKNKYIKDFIDKERLSAMPPKNEITARKEIEESSSSSEYITASDTLCFTLHNVAPLNSPEDRPWKHIEASLSKCPQIPENDYLECNDTIQVVYGFIEDKKNEDNEDRTLSSNSEEDYVNEYVNIEEMNLKNTLASIKADYVNTDAIYDCIENKEKAIKRDDEYQNQMPLYVNNEANKNDRCSNKMEVCSSENVTYVNEIGTYVNEIPTYANTEFNPNYANVTGDCAELLNKDSVLEYDNIINNEALEDIYGPLTDIRFTGPTDTQMMTTSFSDSNDLGDEQDWDSGSDTRSSSSGEFIWKEGEHEASVKALRAVPQDDNQPQDISREDDESSSGSEEEGDSPEFVPSAWDKYATPTKSALRSPEKTLEKLPKKDRGVSFKKQKYHCVYEYPREPESPAVQAYDLWKDSNYMDWDIDRDTDRFVTGTADIETIIDPASTINQSQSRNLYHLSNISDFAETTAMDDDFYISSSAKPFEMYGGTQFFPGKHCDWSELIKNNDNVTPDSGVEDITPGSLSDSSDYVKSGRQILPLKTLAQLAANKNANIGNTEIGGLRHTRNKLKLDLPPSPSAFTKSFSIEHNLDPIISRHVPTFTTFGKSRFVVQHVDTPTDDDKTEMKNVSFEALPYKPMTTHIYKDESDNIEKHRIEMVRGEASLLDSADEDSGIESCTLERKSVSEVSE